MSIIISNDYKQMIVNDYSSHVQTIESLSHKYNLSRPTIIKILKEYNIPTYTKQQLYSIGLKEDIFNVIDTEEKAYWLGFIFADGYVSDNNDFEVSLGIKDFNHLNSLHIFTLGDMSNPMWYLVLTLYMSSQSWYSCGFFWLLWLVDVSVLSNLVYAGSFHPKPTQDHKVSICITIMCMRNSC